MNLTSVLFFTACDANYFELCMDLIKSLRHARGEIPRMRVFDVGLHPQQIEVLRKLVEAVIEPGWDLGQDESYPPWFRAMTSRPFLPKYTSDAEIIVWIDADAWVQSWAPLNDLICAASSGELAIAEESFGAGFAGALKKCGISRAGTRMPRGICRHDTATCTMVHNCFNCRSRRRIARTGHV